MEAVEDKMVEIARFTYPADAQTLMALLRSEGIECYLRDELSSQIMGGYADIGGARVEILESEVQHVILKLKEAGFDQIVINIHHLGEQIIDFLKEKHNFGVQINISDERDYLLDTGGGIKKAYPFLQGNEPFLIHNVDIISNIDLKKLYQSNLETGSLATLLVSRRTTSRQLLFNKENRMCGWQNIKTGEVKSFYPEFDPACYQGYAFSGIHEYLAEAFRNIGEVELARQHQEIADQLREDKEL